MKISVVVPFYQGNQYLKKLLNSIQKVIITTNADFEIIIVNDSPWEKVILPNIQMDVVLINNEKNLGIQATRINGIKHSTGEWILMLDQDDELVAEGFKKQIELTQDADVVVGNGVYILGKVNKKIYKSLNNMNYLIQKERFIKIRNLIPSPGECLIRKKNIPELWKNTVLKNNGSDDWLLWILFFCNNAKFVCNESSVYIHNDTGGNNLSANLLKMRESSLEMSDLLLVNNVLSEKEVTRLRHSIEFKYYQDTKQLSIYRIIKYADAIISNIIYKLRTNICKGI